DRQMMTAVLQHPRCGHRRRAQEGEVVLVLAEPDTATPAATCGGARPPIGLCFAEHFVAADDVGDLPLPVSTERGGEQSRDGGALDRRQISHPQSLALKHGTRKVGPSRLLRSLEGELDLGPTRIVERCQERLSRGDNTCRRVRGGPGRWCLRRRTALD